MILNRPVLRAIAVALALAGAAIPAHALVSLEDGRDHVFVTGNFGIAYDSNVFTNKNSGGDSTISYGLTVEITRQAGWIGVNASVSVQAQTYDHDTTQDFANPAFSAEFTKQTGRTTGSLTLAAQEESRADVAVNTRDTSWNYNAGLNFKYPVIERYSISGSLGYGLVDYTNKQLFTDLSTYSASVDLYYVLSDARDLFGGYRYRYEPTDKHSFDVDNAFTVGVSGKVYGPINGSLRVGYQFRDDHSPITTTHYGDFTGSASLSSNLNRATTISLTASKDFSTTASDTSLDSNTVDIAVQHAVTAKFALTGDVGGGYNDYLGDGGRIVPGDLTSAHRRDEFFNWGAAANYTFNQHLKVSLGYTFYENWSNLSFAVFTRQNYSLYLTSRW